MCGKSRIGTSSKRQIAVSIFFTRLLTRQLCPADRKTSLAVGETWERTHGLSDLAAQQEVGGNPWSVIVGSPPAALAEKAWAVWVLGRTCTEGGRPHSASVLDHSTPPATGVPPTLGSKGAIAAQ